MINSYNDHKRYLIMNIVNHLGAVSRTDLAELTGYQLASISTLTKQLIAENILVETGSYSAGHGRKRTLLKLNSEYLCAISISFSQTEVTCITAQFDGTVLSKTSADFSANTSRSGICACVCGLIQTALEQYTDRCIIGIGICTPSNDPAGYPIVTIDPIFRRLRDWIQAALLPYLRERFTIPIEIFHDITLAILVEQSFGRARGVRDFICVELSNGIGCSICCNGKSVIGSQGYAGELGHTVVDKSRPDPDLCYCGKSGCVEHYASLPVLLHSISSALDSRIYSLLREREDTSKLTVDDIRTAADRGDLLCRHYIKQMAEHLGLAIANTVLLLNPEKVVLYGQMLSLGDYFLEQLKTAIFENLSPKSRMPEDAIVVSPNLLEQLPLGAISELFAGYLKKEDFSWVYQLPQISANE